MDELTAENAADYLRRAGWVSRSDVAVRELSGGVSNIVLRVDEQGREPFVLKQCREKLRVAVEWRARLDRIWVELAVLRVLALVLPLNVVPKVLFEDRAQYLFGMSCAPDDAETWKARLMRGDADPNVAARLGGLLARIHADAPGHPARPAILEDVALFDELRVDPYYRFTANRHPRLASRFNALIAGMDLPADRRALVLGDFSPKNILVHAEGLILLDFECAHLGDPAFDLGFFLSHLILKRIAGVVSEADHEAMVQGFLQSYFDGVGDRLGPAEALETRAVVHTAACLLARVDGKSPVEYLDEPQRETARRSALAVFDAAPVDLNAMHRLLRADARFRG